MVARERGEKVLPFLFTFTFTVLSWFLYAIVISFSGTTFRLAGNYVVKKLLMTGTALLVLLAHFSATPEALELSLLFEKASDYIETGKPDSAAVLLYRNLDTITDKNERVRAYYYLSQAMGQLGRLSEEIQYLIMAREESQEAYFSDRIDLAYTHILLETGNFDDCISIAEEFRHLYADSPLLPDVLYCAGTAHFMKSQYRRAFNTYREISSNHSYAPVSAEAVMKEGMCLMKLDLLGGAIERFELYLSLGRDGNNIDEALYHLGFCYESTGQLERAADAYWRLTIDYPSYSKTFETYFKLGKLYLNIGKLSEAKNAFLNYIANTDIIDENHNKALLDLELIAFRRGYYSSEIEAYENFTTKYPESPSTPDLLFKLATYYRTTTQYREALEKYTILINNPLYMAFADSAAFLMADTYATAQKRYEAVVFLEDFSHECGDSLLTQKILLKIGLLYEEWEEYETAISWYMNAYDAEVSADLSVQALMGIGRIFRGMDRWMQSGETYEKIIKEYPDTPFMKVVLLKLSEICNLEGRLVEAAATAERAVKYAEETEKPVILLHIADIYEEIDTKRALELYSFIYANERNPAQHKTTALLKYGDLALKIGDRESAARAFATIITNGADSISVITAQRQLDSITDSLDVYPAPKGREE